MRSVDDLRELPKRCPEREHVGAGVDGASPQHLGREERQGSPGGRRRSHRVAAPSSDAEVEDLHRVVGRDHDVDGGYVTMHHTTVVCMGERACRG